MSYLSILRQQISRDIVPANSRKLTRLRYHKYCGGVDISIYAALYLILQKKLCCTISVRYHLYGKFIFMLIGERG